MKGGREGNIVASDVAKSFEWCRGKREYFVRLEWCGTNPS